MIDKKGRKLITEATRHLEIGRMEWDEYDKLNDKFDYRDKELTKFYNDMWFCYDPEFPMNRPTNRRDIAKYILFIKSELNYKWQDPEIKDYLIRLIDIITFKIFTKQLEKRITPPFEKQGDISVYPFKTKEEFEETMKRIRVLGHLNSNVPK